MKRIYKYHMDCGRMGDVRSVFAVDDRGEAMIEDLIKSRRRLYFGEILGKHSDITGTLDREELTIVTENQADIDTVLHILCGTSLDGWWTISGHCPLDNLGDED